jgi:hypothetical protein
LTGKACGLDQLRFINRFSRELPADPVTGNYARQVSGALFSKVQPTPVKAPQLLAMVAEVAALSVHRHDNFLPLPDRFRLPA